MTSMPPAIGQRRFWKTFRAAVLVLAYGLASAPAEEAATEAPPATLTGSWLTRAKMEERGVAPFAVLTTEVWGNVAGGLQHGGWWNSLLDFGVELDTATLGWWQGGNFMVQAHWVENSQSDKCFSDYTGTFNPVSSIMAGNQLRVFNLYYRQSWREDAAVLKTGQIAVDDDFMKSDYANLFLNSAFGAMPSQVGTPLATSCGSPPAFPIYSVAAPGVFLALRPSEAFSGQLGLYYGRPGFDAPSNHGFDWANQTPPELGLFWETSYRYQIAQRSATVRLGLSYHTGPVDDFSGSTAGDPPATRQSVPNWYLIHDLELVTAREGKTKLGLFARGGITPQSDRSMVAGYADGGLNWFAPLPSRHDDVAGVAVSYTRFGNAFQASTGPDGVTAAETTLELTYRAQVTRWMALQADLQFLFNPAVNASAGARETATVLGLRAEISF
jgi:porin